MGLPALMPLEERQTTLPLPLYLIPPDQEVEKTEVVSFEKVRAMLASKYDPVTQMLDLSDDVLRQIAVATLSTIFGTGPRLTSDVRRDDR